MVNKINASESLSRDFDFTVELLSDEASVALKEMQGKLLSIELVLKSTSKFSITVSGAIRVSGTYRQHRLPKNSADSRWLLETDVSTMDSTPHSVGYVLAHALPLVLRCLLATEGKM